MIIAMPIKTSSHDATLAPLFGNAKYFAFTNDNIEINVIKMEQTGGRDIARTLVANNVDVLITSHLGLNPYVLLKSYGIKIYFAEKSEITFNEVIKALFDNKLMEITTDNYESLLGEYNHHGKHHHHVGGACCSHNAHA